MGDQEFDITKAVECMTKYCEMVIDAKKIKYCLNKALYVAQEEVNEIIGGSGYTEYGKIQGDRLVSIQPDISKLINGIEWTPRTSFAEGIKKIIKNHQNQSQ